MQLMYSTAEDIAKRINVNLNEDNIRIPYDWTGPYRYYLVFPSNDGNKVQIKPNADSNALILGIG